MYRFIYSSAIAYQHSVFLIAFAAHVRPKEKEHILVIIQLKKIMEHAHIYIYSNENTFCFCSYFIFYSNLFFTVKQLLLLT